MNISAIFIKPATSVDDQKLLDLFGYGNALPAANAPQVAKAIYPRKNTLNLIRHGDAVVICVLDFPIQFCDKEPSYIENKLVDFFPGSEIFAALFSNEISYAGYALVQRGERKRIKVMFKEYDAEVLQPLPEELTNQGLPETIYAIAGNFVGGPPDRNDSFLSATVKSFTLAAAYSDDDELKEIPRGKYKFFTGKTGKRLHLVAMIILLTYVLIRLIIFLKKTGAANPGFSL